MVVAGAQAEIKEFSGVVLTTINGGGWNTG
jgi:hypothetical protein